MRNDNCMTTATINKIEHYLANDMPLTEYQKECIIYALNKVRDLRQVPYYEVIYHDEYDRTERRIMEPVSMDIINNGSTEMQRDHFELDFNRILR